MNSLSKRWHHYQRPCGCYRDQAKILSQSSNKEATSQKGELTLISNYCSLPKQGLLLFLGSELVYIQEKYFGSGREKSLKLCIISCGEVFEQCYTKTVFLPVHQIHFTSRTPTGTWKGNMIYRRESGQWGDLLSSLLVIERVVQVTAV